MALWHLSAIAADAIEGLPEPPRAPLGAQDPRAQLEGRAVAHMLPVPTGQLGDPVALRVLMKTSHLALHARSLRDRNTVS